MSGPSEQLLSGQGRNDSALDRDNHILPNTETVQKMCRVL